MAVTTEIQKLGEKNSIFSSDNQSEERKKKLDGLNQTIPIISLNLFYLFRSDFGQSAKYSKNTIGKRRFKLISNNGIVFDLIGVSA